MPIGRIPQRSVGIEGIPPTEHLPVHKEDQVTATITPNQQRFIRDLVLDRMTALGVDDVDRWLLEQNVAALTSKAASTFIDAIKAIAADTKPEHAHLPAGRVICNKYAKDCQTCGGHVGPGDGFCVETSEGWRTFHKQGECTSSTGDASGIVRPVIEPNKSYLLEDGTVIVGYRTRNGYLAVRKFEDGALEYWQGGLKIARATVVRPLTHEEAALLGQTYGVCCNCARGLTNDQSLAAGYGPECANNNGWWYPTPTEAAAILKRRTAAL